METQMMEMNDSETFAFALISIFFRQEKTDLNFFELNPNSIFLPAAKFKVFEFNFKALNLICPKQLYDYTTHIIRINFNKH